LIFAPLFAVSGVSVSPFPRVLFPNELSPSLKLTFNGALSSAATVSVTSAWKWSGSNKDASQSLIGTGANKLLQRQGDSVSFQTMPTGLGLSPRVGGPPSAMTFNVALKDGVGATVTDVLPVTLPSIEAAPSVISFQKVALAGSSTLLGRESFGLVVDPISDTLFMLHGWDPVGLAAINEVQKSTDGATWTNVPVSNGGIVGRSSFCTLVVPPTDPAATSSVIFFMGGNDGSNFLSDNWMTSNQAGEFILHQKCDSVVSSPQDLTFVVALCRVQ
jgi:hypothetical protein